MMQEGRSLTIASFSSSVLFLGALSVGGLIMPQSGAGPWVWGGKRRKAWSWVHTGSMSFHGFSHQPARGPSSLPFCR